MFPYDVVLTKVYLEGESIRIKKSEKRENQEKEEEEEGRNENGIRVEGKVGVFLHRSSNCVVIGSVRPVQGLQNCPPSHLS